MKRTEHTQKWLDALRSGEYEQIQGTLQDEDGYCCIGVAAHIIGAKGGNDDRYARATNAMGLSDKEMWHCVNMNDGLAGMKIHTFPEIADAIEQMLDGN